MLADTEGFGQHGTVGSISPGCHRSTACLEHHTPVGTGVRNTLRVGFTVADREEEVSLVTGFVDDVGDAVATFTDTEVVICQSSTREDIGQQHVIDVADMGQMTVPVHSVGVSTLDLRVDGVAGQAMPPEDGSHDRLEVRLVPNIGMQVAPFLIPWCEVGLIDSQSLGVGFWDELWLTGYRPYVLRVFRLTEAHVVIAAY